MKQVNQISDLDGFTGLVLFTASWCSPCVQYKPVLEKFAKDRGLQLVFVDAGKFRDIAGHYAVRAVPTTFYFTGGAPLMRKQGAQTEAALETLVP